MVEGSEKLPKIRFVEAYPIMDKGQELYVLTDPYGYAPSALSVSREVVFIAQQMNGENTYDQVVSEFAHAFRKKVSLEEIEQLVGFLDENLLLETPHFQDTKLKIEQDFLDSDLRPPACFDPKADPGELREFLDDLFLQAGFPKGPEIEATGGNIAGIIAPHIDYGRGGKTYGKAYGELFSQFTGDTLIVIGTNHQFADTPVIMTKKDFDTPFGIVATDDAIVDEIAGVLPQSPFLDETAHRREHSIEYAATMIAYAGRAKNVKIVPILISGMNGDLLDGIKPDENNQISSLAKAIGNLVRKEPSRTAIIASADLAHIGQQFDDEFSLEDSYLDEVRQHDLKLLDSAGSFDSDNLSELISQTGDKYRICGFGPIYTMIKSIENAEGEVLEYNQWLRPERTGAVSFAAVVFNRK